MARVKTPEEAIALLEGPAQDVFDYVVEHLRSMSKRSMSENNTCAYFGENGAACAAGCLFPDEWRAYVIEEKSADEVLLDLGRADVVSSPYADLLQDLQCAHDKEANWDESGLNAVGERHLSDIAGECDLTYTPPQ